MSDHDPRFLVNVEIYVEPANTAVDAAALVEAMFKTADPRIKLDRLEVWSDPELSPDMPDTEDNELLIERDFA